MPRSRPAAREAAVRLLSGLILALLPAPAGGARADQSTFAATNLPAVEIHQVSGRSSEISFDLELVGNTLAQVVRGPYLQTGTPTSMIVRWRTSVATNSRVRIGPDPGSLTTTVDDPAPVLEHTVPLSGLTPNTRYYYSIGTTTQVLAGGDADHFFATSPPAGTPEPTRIWVIGDSGTAGATAAAVRDDYLSLTPPAPTDVWLMLGDNAYPSGTEARYQAAVFDMYPTLLRNTVLWPTLGNHDAEPAGVSSSAGIGPYFDLFDLPTAGEAGGLPSGTEAYYSFDHGNIHFISLNSTGSDRSPGSPMLTWLENDLAATTQDWIIAYWHHPPYTRGSHDSDDPLDSGGRMFDMRENVLPILDAGGVDLVLNGHSHAYERSFLLSGHYGPSNTLASGMILDAGDGREGGDGAYRQKPTGTVYVVDGSSGTRGGGPLDHPVMVVSWNQPGSVVLDVDSGRLDARFLSGGVTLDSFTLLQGPACVIEMSQASYATGDQITASVFRLVNPGNDSLAVELKVWLEIPGLGPIGLMSFGANGSFALPAGFDTDLGPLPLVPITAAMPRGTWALDCRMLDPVTGDLLAEDLNPFPVVGP